MIVDKDNVSAIIIDLDGTLLDSNKNISARSIGLLNTIQDLGVKIIIATGRTLRSASGYCDGLDFKSPIILGNGTLVYDFQKNDYSLSFFQDEKVTDLLLDEATKGLKIQMYTHDMIFKNANLADTYSASDKYDDAYMFPLSDILPYKKSVIKTLLLLDDESDTSEVRNILAKKYSDKVSVVRTWITCYEIQNIVANKGNALKHIAKMYDFDLKKAIAIGDADNDLPMLESVGYPIAMANASEAVLKATKKTIKSNDEEGVFHFLSEFFEINNIT